jgi:bifunctional non-homologous end joining protein LigD
MATPKRTVRKPKNAKLRTYRAKRDFTRTAEPSGRKRVAKSRQLRFVIQKHAATRLHYDFRLELGGVFKSWAVTRGPSLDPSDKRLAVEVEDHPLDYGDFEGTIPKGEYGGGAVLMWDRGYWAPEPGVDPERALKKGELKFFVAGKRLKGGFVLVRLRPRDGEKRNNWLLIKHKDEFARKGGADILDEDRSIASGRAMDQIAAGKGRKPKGFMMLERTAKADAVWPSRPVKKEKTASASRPASGKPVASMPEFVAPQLCRLVERAPPGAGWGHEVKFDGYRTQLRVEDGDARLRTRSGLDWTPKFRSIAKAGASLPDCMIDGEIIALDRSGDPSFAALQEALSEGRSEDLIFYAFDLLFLNGRDLRSLRFTERKAHLGTLLGRNKAIRYTDHITGSGEAVYEAACRVPLEGIVSKQLHAPYRSGRGDTWVKSKCRGGQEVVIGGWTEQNGRFRSLLVGVNQKGRFVYAGRVGTGFGQSVVDRLLPKLKSVAAKTSPFSGKQPPRKGVDIRWARPRLVAEVEFAGWTGDKLLRQASFKGLRQDKAPAAITVETPRSEKQMAKAKPIPVRYNANTVLGVTISHPDKPLWPASGATPALTKLDLARYFETVGDWMLAHIRGRPCSVIRMPDGVKGQTFFQRHGMKGGSDHFTLTKVKGDKQPYLQIDTIEALIAAAQIACVELHPWNCRPDDPETPGRLVFDLDPGTDVDFSRVIDAAREVRDRLAALGLEAFCKTTGGKGLHVVTPFAKPKRRELNWPEAKEFALAVCRRMAADSPSLYLTTMAKKDRTGRIFLDYLRNDRTATAVAPLSPRGRAGAPVSMPIHWSQAKKGLDPARYNLATAPALLRKSGPWADYDAGERDFFDAAKKLLKS